MKTSRLGPAVVAVALCVAASGPGCGRKAEEETATKGRLSVCVSEAHLELFQREADQFNSLYKEAGVAVFGATTREAIVNLLNDSVPMIATDRPLNAEEQAVVVRDKIDIQEVAIARDALAIVVSRLNGAGTFSMESLQDMLTRKVTDWSQVPGSGLVGPIELVLTDRNSGAYELVKEHFFDLAEDLPVAVVLASQRAVVEYVGKHPQALGMVSVACYRSPSVGAVTADSSGTVKALAFAGVDSTGQQATHRLHQANIHLGRYPLGYDVYIYFSKDSDLAAGFAGFVAGAEGQKIVLDWGLVPVTMPVRIVTLT
ncbi:MAG: substrate-binding domain-containing protein [bacterium]